MPNTDTGKMRRGRETTPWPFQLPRSDQRPKEEKLNELEDVWIPFLEDALEQARDLLNRLRGR